MILLVDNYDSFTFNLVQQFNNTDIQVIRNDAPNLIQLAEAADGIVLSPGPGRPSGAGEMENIIAQFYKQKPILGICLGHQAIGEVFGAQVIAAPQIMHGKQSTITYRPKGLFAGRSDDIRVMRYHSLVVDPNTLPEELEVIAETSDCIMALQHKDYPLYGLQFHPESLGSPDGQAYIDRFLEVVNVYTPLKPSKRPVS